MMESVFGQDPYVAYLLATFAGFTAVAAVGTLICWIAGIANPRGERI